MENDVTNITLLDENNEEVEFKVITKLDIQGKEYIIVVRKGKDTDEAIALRIDKDQDEKDILVTIDDDDEFAVVSEAYETLFAEDENKLN